MNMPRNKRILIQMLQRIAISISLTMISISLSKVQSILATGLDRQMDLTTTIPFGHIGNRAISLTGSQSSNELQRLEYMRVYQDSSTRNGCCVTCPIEQTLTMDEEIKSSSTSINLAYTIPLVLAHSPEHPVSTLATRHWCQAVWDEMATYWAGLHTMGYNQNQSLEHN